MNELQKKYQQEICAMVEACRRCAELNYVTSSGGNLSLRVDENRLLITPTKTLKRKMEFDDICLIDQTGNIIYAKEGKKPTGEWPFHTRIMAKRPDVRAIVHAHPPCLTGFAIANDGSMNLPYLPEPIIEIGPLCMVPYETPLSEALSEKFDAVMDLSNGFLMENHGAVFCSPIGIGDAVELLNMAECMASSVFVAKVLGNAKPIPAHFVREMDEVIRIRKLKMPGASGKYQSASELYRQ
ncbi:MAG: class II aldolase/adducin family protein [Ruthenibacterium sp.]